jgi:hypothetical protein
MFTIVLSVVRASEGFTSIGLILPGIAFHAVMAVGGVQLCGVAKRMKLKKVASAQAQAA